MAPRPLNQHKAKRNIVATASVLDCIVVARVVTVEAFFREDHASSRDVGLPTLFWRAPC